ncbi:MULTISPECIES: tripartite tricarboxylate transporter substrate-binding protein [unclassified Acidovorax]|uniref:tripartite tricarboxylate transporter substrate-binding protein n=1 Tax=unclassified Acidovorax TaxID=2684926 RepID=UPI001F2321CD|nr:MULTISPECIES: tripartite tricarboxylate transporter substrate-binding protein [unclassified Acidovorax]
MPSLGVLRTQLLPWFADISIRMQHAPVIVKAAANGFHGQLRIALSDGSKHSRLPSLLPLCRQEEHDVEIWLFEVGDGVVAGRGAGAGVAVDNKPGASGQLAASAVARATPDGTTLLLDASSFAVNPSLYPKLPYDSNTAFVPLAVLATLPNVLVCHPGFGVNSVKEVIARAKAKPEDMAYASAGNGSAQHLARTLLAERTDVRLSHIPYRGGGPAMNDVMGGQVPLFFANVASSLGHIQAGKLRPLTVTSAVRAYVGWDPKSQRRRGVGTGLTSYQAWLPSICNKCHAGLSGEAQVVLSMSLAVG